MYTHGPGLVIWRKVLMPFLTLILSGLFLAAWISIVSAQNADAIKSEQPTISEVEDNLGLIQPSTNQTLTATQQPSSDVPFGLKITKSQLPLTFTVSSNNRYIINVSRANTGTITSTISVEDDLPAGMTWTPPTSAGNWDCTTSSGSTSTKVSCFYANAIPVSLLSFDPINVIVTVSPDVAEVVTNTASLLYAGNTLSASISTPIRSADLAIEKTQGPTAIPSVNTPITYTIVVTNNGPSLASNVVISDSLPTELNSYHVASRTPPGLGSIITTSNSIQWQIPSLPNGELATLVLTTTPKSTSNGKQIVNTARVSSSTYDYDQTNNTASTSFVVGGLEIGKKVDTTNTYAGAPFEYTIFVTNTSFSSIGATVRDNFTDTLDVLDCYVNNSANKCYVSGNNLNYFLYVPGSTTYAIHIKARGNQDIGSIPQTITNTATVTWGSPSFTLKSDPVELVISPGGYVQVGKSDDLDSVYPGETVTYTISITNTGSLGIASGSLQVTDTILNNLTYVSLDKNGLTMNEVYNSGNVRSWTLPSKALAAGEKISFFISATVADTVNGDTTSNRASADGEDIAGHSNTSTATDIDTVSVVSQGSISMKKTVTPEQANVGETFTFKIVLSNRSTESVSDIIVNDYFPDALDLSSATTSRGTALLSTSSREVEVDIPEMDPGDQTTIVILAKVNTTVKAAKTYRNKAYIKWTGISEFSTNNIPYRVLPSGTLPGTGSVGVAGTYAGMSLSTGAFAAGALLLLLGLTMFGVYLWARGSRPLSAGKYARNGLILLALAALCGIGAILATPQSAVPGRLSMLSGEKPPIATSLPVLPVSTNPPENAGPVEPTSEVAEQEYPVDLLPVRPTPDPLQPTEEPAATLTEGEVDISHLLPTPTPSELPNYPIPTPSALTTVGPDGGEPDSSAVQRLVIPAMGLDTIVKYVPFSSGTWLISGLKQEIAWMGDTSWPGLGSNTGLAGHVDLATGEKGPFWNLKDLAPGDEVIVYTVSKIYTYRVREQEIVDDTDISVIQPTTKPQLTLITCTGWDTEVRIYLKRLIVFADLIKVGSVTALSN